MESSNYVAKELNLTTADAVPEDAEIIIIPAPKNDITDAEKDKLNDYLDKGGNISFLMSPNGDKVRYKNIEAILDKYAICMDYDKVYETDNSKHVSGDPYTIIAELVECRRNSRDGMRSRSSSRDDKVLDSAAHSMQT